MGEEAGGERGAARDEASEEFMAQRTREVRRGFIGSMFRSMTGYSSGIQGRSRMASLAFEGESGVRVLVRTNEQEEKEDMII